MNADPIVLAPAGAVPMPPESVVAAAPPPAPDPETVAEAMGDPVAARLRAKYEQMRKGTHDFPLPGWDGLLVLRARTLKDRKELQAEVGDLTNTQLILRMTAAVLRLSADGTELEEIADGWAGLGSTLDMDLDGLSLGQIVELALDNPLRLDGFAEDLLAWKMGRRSAIEQVLGG